MSCKSVNYRVPKDIGKELVTITVNREIAGKTLTIHKKLLQTLSKSFEEKKVFRTDGGGDNVILVEDQDDFATWELFVKWAYTGTVEKAQTRFSSRVKPSKAELETLEANLREIFNMHMGKLITLYGLAEEYNIEPLMNKTIDTIQDGYLEFGSVFGPLSNLMVFGSTKEGSKLRELCVGSVMIHLDKGCSQLRDEVGMACITIPGYMKCMLKWTAQNFAMFGKRERIGFDVRQGSKGFSMFNRDKICPCQFHVHGHGEQPHLGHDRCTKPTDLTCEHPDETNATTDFLRSSILGNRTK